jgi:CheY-like chemotaxis protein
MPVAQIRPGMDSKKLSRRPPAGAEDALGVSEQRFRALIENASDLISVVDPNGVILGNGGDGLDQFSNGRFDLVIVDRAMPDMSGDQVASTIKTISPATPIIMLTGVGVMMEATDEKPDNVDLVVGKPVTIAGLRRALLAVALPSSLESIDPVLEDLCR